MLYTLSYLYVQFVLERPSYLCQVWSFAPPEVDLEGLRSYSPMSMPDHSSDDLYSEPPTRPVSALPTTSSAPVVPQITSISDNDIPMPDAGIPA